MNKDKIFLPLLMLSFFLILSPKPSYSIESGTWNVAYIYRGTQADTPFAISNAVYTSWFWNPEIHFDGVHSFKASPNTGAILKKYLSITNNEKGSFRFRIQPLEIGNFDFDTLYILHNGKLINPNDTIFLDIDESQTLEVYMEIPPTAIAGDFRKIEIIATDANTGKSISDITNIIIENGIQKVTLELHSSKDEVYVDEELTLMANFENHGDTIHSTQIMVDGSEIKGVAMMMTIPVGFGFMGISPPSDGEILYKERDSEDNEFTKSIDDNTDILKVGYLIERFNINQAIDMEIKVQVKEEAQETNEFLSTLFYLNTDTMHDDSIRGDTIVVKKMETTEIINSELTFSHESILQGDGFTIENTITNNTTENLDEFELNLELPIGVSLKEGNILIEGFDISDFIISPRNIVSFKLSGSSIEIGKSKVISYVVTSDKDSIIGENTISTSGIARGNLEYIIEKTSDTINILNINTTEPQFEVSPNKNIIKVGEVVNYNLSLTNTLNQNISQIEFQHKFPKTMKFLEETIVVTSPTAYKLDYSFDEIGEDIVYTFMISSLDLNPLETTSISFDIESTNDNIGKNNEHMNIAKAYTDKFNFYSSQWQKQIILVYEESGKEIELDMSLSHESILQGDGFTIENTITNNTTENLDEFELNLELPIGVSLKEDNILIEEFDISDFSISPRNIVSFKLSGSSIEIGKSKTISYVVTSDKDSIIGENTISIYGIARGNLEYIIEKTSDAINILNINTTEPQFEVSPNKTIIKVGEVVNYNLSLTNTLNQNVSQIEFQHKFPKTMKFLEETIKVTSPTTYKLDYSFDEIGEDIVYTFMISSLDLNPLETTSISFDIESTNDNIGTNNEHMNIAKAYTDKFNFYPSQWQKQIILVYEESGKEIELDMSLSHEYVLEGDEFSGSSIIKNSSQETLQQFIFSVELPIGMIVSKNSIIMDNFTLDSDSFVQEDNIFTFILDGNLSIGNTEKLSYSVVTSEDSKLGENQITQNGEAVGSNLYLIEPVSKTIDVIKIGNKKIGLDKNLERDIIKFGELAKYELSFVNTDNHKFEKLIFQHKFPKNMKLIESSISLSDGIPPTSISYDSEDIGDDTIYTFTINHTIEADKQDELVTISFDIDPSKENIQKDNESMSVVKAYSNLYQFSSSSWEKRVINIADDGQDKIKINKTVDKNRVSPTQLLSYNIEIENTTSETLKRIDLFDILPQNFKLIEDTLDVNSNDLDISLISTESPNEFYLNGELKVGEKVSITYKVELDTSIPVGIYKDSTYLEGFGESYFYSSNENNLEVEVVYEESTNMIPITKEVNKNSISVGELLQYTIKLKNNTGEVLKKLEVDDKLPRGFKLLAESVETSDNVKLVDVEHGDIKRFILEGDIQNEEEILLTYYVRVENFSTFGTLVNRAWGRGWSINNFYNTTIASASVSVEDDLFEQKGIIFGRVFIDTNKNKLFDTTGDIELEEAQENNNKIIEEENIEIGVPGVKVYLENGDFAITDKFGMYSIYGQRAITHTVKIDRHTIPYLSDDGKNGKLSKITNKHNSRGDLSFADLKTAQLHKVNFAFVDVDKEFIEKVKSRANSTSGFYNELEYEFERDLALNSSESYLSNPNTSQIKDGHSEVNFTFRENEEYENIDEEFEEDIERKKLSLEDQLLLMNNDIDFIELSDGDYVGQRLRVRIKGPRGGYLNLYINDELVPIEKIGLRAASQGNNLFFLEYSLLELNKGNNKLSITFNDMFNIERERKSINVIATGKQEDFDIEVLSDPIADPTQAIEIKIQARDINNNKSLDLINIEADVDKGKWLDNSISKQGNKLNINGEKGEYTFKYIPPDSPEEVNFKFTSQGITKSLKIKLLPNLRPFTISGIVEGRYDKNISSRDDNGIDNYIFEDNLEGFDPLKQENISNRVAVFGKGSIWNEYLLTFSYDNNKQEKNFFKDISTEKHYPVYGDSSVRGFEAKSTSDLYLKIDKNHSSFLYGDYSADWTKEETTKLGQINRTLTGVYHKYDSNNLLINTFVAQTKYTHTSDEMRGLGISGPYHLSKNDIVVGSETITIITRDNVSNSIIIKEETLSRFQDYTIDYNSASIYFLEPKMSIDENGNPIFIRIDYEVEGSGEEHIVWGNHLEYTIKDTIKLGWNYAKDDNPSDFLELKSVFGKLNFSETTTLIMEYTESYSRDFGTGDAFRTAFKLKEENHLIEFEYLNTSETFYNPNSSSSSGIEANNFKYQLELKDFKFINTVKYQEDRINSTSDLEILSGIEKKMTENLDTKLYLRYANEKGVENNDSTSIGLRFNQKIPQLTGLTTFFEIEQDITNFDKRRIALGGDYQLEPKTKLYVRQELFSTYEDSYALSPTDSSNSTLIGIKSDYFSVATLFSEYAILNSTSEREAKASAGVKKDIEISEELSIGVTLEKIFPLKYDDSTKEEDITSGTFSYFWTPNTTLKTTGNFEGSHTKDKYLLTNKFDLIKKISTEKSFILKERYQWNRDISDTGKDDTHKGILTLGLAHRDHQKDASNWLFKYNLSYIQEDANEYTHISNVLSYSIHDQLSEISTNTLTLAGKQVYERYGSYSSNYTAYMAAYNYSRDITDRIDINLNAVVYGDDGFKEFKYGLGGEVGVRIIDNFWLSAGYNITGFVDNEFDDFGYFKEGIYIRFRVYIDEDIFNIRK